MQRLTSSEEGTEIQNFSILALRLVDAQIKLIASPTKRGTYVKQKRRYKMLLYIILRGYFPLILQVV